MAWLFCTCGVFEVIVIALLLPFLQILGGELGGKTLFGKLLISFFLIFLWLIYIILSSLKAYNKINW